jgi:hypothetical protein
MRVPLFAPVRKPDLEMLERQIYPRVPPILRPVSVVRQCADLFPLSIAVWFSRKERL